MPDQRVYIHTADATEQGSFCDKDSQTHYENTSHLRTEIDARAYSDRGVQVIESDVSGDPDQTFPTDQRFNQWLIEEDSQQSWTSAKHRVGGV
jgi:hypothetical protein